MNKFERLVTKVVIVLDGTEKNFLNIHNIESLRELGLKEDSQENNTGFLEIGNTITINESKFIITEITFKLENPSTYPNKLSNFEYLTNDKHSATNSTIFVIVKSV